MADAKSQCRLYFQVPAPITAKLESQLAQALTTTSVACVVLCDNSQNTEEVPTDEPSDRLIDRIQGANIACLIENDFERAERLGADGVHIAADLERYTTARNLLGQSANIGVDCGADRHAAMELAEAGADYVAFGPESEGLVAWWSEVFVVPCVAWNVDTAAEAERFAQQGADFVAPSRTIWQADNAATIVADIGRAIAHVRSTA
jgi:thiamine-phosphate pyrophosphorylase